MNNQSMDAELSKWYSSYGLVTAERIFDTLGIHLNQDDLLLINQNHDNCYYQLLQIPLKNIFNGIIIDQTTDYREYAQKMIIDYLISGAANQVDDQTKLSGAKLQLEDMRASLMSEGDKFDLVQFEHHKLILDSQKALIKLAKKLPASPKAVEASDSSFVAAIKPYMEQAESLAQRVKQFRSQFYDTILKARELLNTLPDYFNRFEAESAHIEALGFDMTLGDDERKTTE